MARQPESGTFLDMFSRFGRDLKLPNVDVEAILGQCADGVRPALPELIGMTRAVGNGS